MISDSRFYHGSVIATLLEHYPRGFHVRRLDETAAGVLLIEDRLPLMIKYSTSRRSPWTFTFKREHQIIQQSLFEKYEVCITAFVCDADGIVALSHNNMRKVLDHDFEDQENIRITRKLNERYRISGRDGSLERPVSRKSLLDLFLPVLTMASQDETYSSIPSEDGSRDCSS